MKHLSCILFVLSIGITAKADQGLDQLKNYFSNKMVLFRRNIETTKKIRPIRSSEAYFCGGKSYTFATKDLSGNYFSNYFDELTGYPQMDIAGSTSIPLTG
ncbi:MAG: hypothetical protein PHY93_04965 [Bacteriovorax sp.]|nr:hypothetical protein [Bacteriovorax sp.]